MRNREADQRLVFAIQILQFIYFLNPKFQASSHLLWLYSPVCVGPGLKPRRPVFSQRGFFVNKNGLAVTVDINVSKTTVFYKHI